MLSFTSELRRQLAARTRAQEGGVYRKAELAGLIDAAGVYDDAGVTLRTASAAVARSVVRLWRSEFGLESRLSPPGPNPFGRTRYAVRVEGNSALQAAEELRVEQERSLRETDAGGAAYLRGAFQGTGSVTRPDYRRGQHLEFAHPDEAFVRRVTYLSRTPLKVIMRRGRWVAYTKGADGVTTLLAQMGLHEAVLEYEAQVILGEAKANANRVTNFDAANAARTAIAAARQQEAPRAPRPQRAVQGAPRDAGAQTRAPGCLSLRTGPARRPDQERRQPPSAQVVRHQQRMR
ncbi:MAG: DNA-binding protein WhiA [Actinomycetota bacterium]|nr:DNA-binding protein WhiA [Actinomycetota bacterium]